jgi:hypothetical protein
MNLAGLVSVILPGTITMIWFLPMSWLLGVPAGFLMYLLLHPVLKPGPG